MNKEEFLLALNKEGLLIYGTTWLENFKRLQELKKYKEMWGELEKFHKEHPNDYLVLSSNDVYKALQNVKQKYFPKPEKIITIEVNEITEANLDAINEKIKMFIDKRFYFYEGTLGKIHIKESD